MPSFAENALAGIKKHPEIFAALEEYERTKKVRKLSPRKHIDLTIDPALLKEFRVYCRERGMSMSRFVERCIRKEIQAARAAERS